MLDIPTVAAPTSVLFYIKKRDSPYHCLLINIAASCSPLCDPYRVVT